MSDARCYLNALGAVNGLGTGIDAIARGLFAGDRNGVAALPDLLPGVAAWVGRVRDALPEVVDARFRTRNNALLLAALAQIEGEVDAAIERYGAARVGVVLGSSTSGIREGEVAFSRRRRDGAWPAGFDYVQQEVAGPSEYLRARLGVSGPCYTISTACTSSAKALGAARRLLLTGVCDAVVVGGVDSLCKLTVRGFAALESLAPGPCNPSSANRAGINVGEAAALFLASREPGPVALLGIGESSDGHHFSAPDPTGAGAELAMRAALADAGVTAAAIGYVNLHGTATVQNDLMESHAVARVFGTDLPCSSTKALVGHTLGAAGATEAAFCWLALRAGGMLPPHCWDGVPDPLLAPLALIGSGTRVAAQRALLASNSFAFGGSNAVLIMGPG